MADLTPPSTPPSPPKDLSQGSAPPEDKDFAQYRVKQEKDRWVFRRVAFYGLVILLIIFLVTALWVLRRIVCAGVFTTQEAIILTVVVACPIVLSLALLRVAFADSRSKQDQDIGDSPGVLAALLKELLSVVQKH